jgi:hypothetical protein
MDRQACTDGSTPYEPDAARQAWNGQKSGQPQVGRKESLKAEGVRVITRYLSDPDLKARAARETEECERADPGLRHVTRRWGIIGPR